MRTGRILTSLILLLLVTTPLSALTTVTAVTGMGYLYDMAFGNITAFPSSATIKHSAVGYEFFPSVKTDLEMIIDFGLESRKLLQNLENGDYVYRTRGDTYYDYSAFHSAVSYRMNNHMFPNGHTDDYYLDYSIAVNIHFEQAFESFRNMRNSNYSIISPDPSSPLPSWYTQGPGSIPQLSSIATPDFNGNGYLLSNSFILKVTYDDMYKEKNSIFREGMEANVTLQLAPDWLFNSMNRYFGGRSDFYKLSGDLENALILYNRNREDGSSLLKIVLDNVLQTQVIFGSAIPRYADKLTFYTLTDGLNLTFTIRDRLRLYFYGPTFFTDNTLPYAYIFVDGGYAGGRLHNSTAQPVKHLGFITAGIHLHLIIMGIFNVTGEFSYTYSNAPAYITPIQWGIYAYFAVE